LTISAGADLPLFGYTAHPVYSSYVFLAPYRVYDASIGRWLSEDPIGVKGGTNLSSYVSNNPIVKFDPFGLKCVPATSVQYVGLDTYKHHWPINDERPENYNLIKFDAACDCCEGETLRETCRCKLVDDVSIARGP
jgi:RHS repeat-associated protein